MIDSTVILRRKIEDILEVINGNPKLASSTKARYKKVVADYLNAGGDLTDADNLARYAKGLSKSGRSFLKAAIRLWGESVALKAKAEATPETISAVQATIFRIEALNEAIQIEATKGQKAHTWLTQSEVKQVLDTCDTNTLQGQRDKIVLGLLVGAGLRREELARLTFDAVLSQPVANTNRMVLNVTGKGAKDRVIPINDNLARALSEWKMIVDGGFIPRSIRKGAILETVFPTLVSSTSSEQRVKRLGNPNSPPTICVGRMHSWVTKQVCRLHRSADCWDMLH